MAIKVEVTNVKNVTNNIKSLFEKFRTDPELLNELGIKLVTQTQDFNRAGKRPEDGKSHKKITPEWAERKEKLKSKNAVSEYYQSGASNVTFTGQLLRAIKYKLFASEGTVKVFVDGKRAPYKQLNGKSVSSANTPNNEELAGYLKEQGRPIFGVGRQIDNTLVKIVRTFLNKKIRDSIFRSRKS